MIWFILVERATYQLKAMFQPVPRESTISQVLTQVSYQALRLLRHRKIHIYLPVLDKTF
jgi:hypothetical protein